MTEPLVDALGPRATRIVKLGEGRFTIELPLDAAPDRILGEISAAGASVISLNPVRDTLEDFFVQQVSAPDVQARTRGLGERP
jgi:hypothetical protein